MGTSGDPSHIEESPLILKNDTFQNEFSYKLLFLKLNTIYFYFNKVIYFNNSDPETQQY